MPPTQAPQKAKNPLKVGKKKSATKTDEAVDELEEWKKSRQLLKPKDQLEISDAELKEILGRALTTKTVQVPDSLVQYDYATNSFIPIRPPDNIVTVFEMKGTYIHKDTAEAKAQMLEQGVDPALFDLISDSFSEELEAADAAASLDAIKETVEELGEGEEKPEGEDGEEGKEDVEGGVKEGEVGEEVEEGEEGGGEGEGEQAGEGDEVSRVDAEDTVSRVTTGGRPKKLTNQFNFCERAALTYNNPTRSQDTQTTPPPMATFSSNVLQWIIYDSYQQDYAAQMLEKELERERKEKEKAPVSRHAVAPKKIAGRAQLSEAVQGRVFECWKVLERMINLNTYDDIAKDYRYWDDPSDEFRDEEGTLLPLWKFTYDKTKKNTVTYIGWNPWYYDLFAVCFGFLDFMKPIPEGAVCMFTLKNPSYPDYICMTDSAVMCVDTHRKYPYMIVIGLYDGSVNVFNVQASCKEPAFKSNKVLNKHDGIVWEVRWAPDLPDGEMNFFSVAADGKINNWVVMQNELAVTTIITLFLVKEPVLGPDGIHLKMKGSASCITFHPKQAHIYLVGTEEGLIYKCSTAYNSMYLLTLQAHHMPVYRIDFNKFNPDIFASCSGDWRIKIWEDNRTEPLFVFDVGACVGDVKWAPYSSTVFAAVTTEGKVYVFDLNVNKYKPICIQAVVSKRRNKLTRLSFNHKLPILIVGDDKGCVTTLKLSPNLRIPCKPPKKQQYLDQWTLQLMKLDKLLALVREPPSLSLPPDTSGISEDS